MPIPPLIANISGSKRFMSPLMMTQLNAFRIDLLSCKLVPSAQLVPSHKVPGTHVASEFVCDVPKLGAQSLLQFFAHYLLPVKQFNDFTHLFDNAAHGGTTGQ